MNLDFKNIGFYQIKLSGAELLPICNEIQELQSKFNHPMSIDMNHKLAGQIAREYELSENTRYYLENIISPHLFSYTQHYKNYFENTNLTLQNSWVNFQKSSEFNPPHNHSGIISFVIWIKIPYTIEAEFNNNFVKYSNTPLAGCFSFLYNTSIGSITQHAIKAGADHENTLLLFPAQLNHCVYPFFTSDEYRISVAGNFE